MDADPTLPLAFARSAGVAIDPDQDPAPDAPLRLIARASASDLAWREARRVLGRPVAIRLCSDQAFDQALEQTQSSRDTEASDSHTFEGDDIEIERGGERGLVTDLLDDAADAPVIGLINTLLRQALRRGASDMHVEAMEQGIRVRMRIDGILRTVVERPDAPVAMVVSRFKVMAGLDIAETRMPQDGRLALRIGGRSVDVRISTMPAKNGERGVLRLLDKRTGLLSLGEIGLSPDQRAALDRIGGHSDGLVLVTGPTGSGKTTTLYALIQHLNDSQRNIITVEDPIEYDIAGIGQTQVMPQIGMGFAQSLRAILRQDPDIVLVGEIRDQETAEVAVQAALTGHLVLATLHTNTALGSITRLRDLGVEPYLIAATVRGMIAQRLLRRLCRDCRRPDPVTEDAARVFERSGLAMPLSLFGSEGCAACDGTGFRGRTAVYEIVEVETPLRALIHEGKTELELAGAALPPDGRLAAAALRLAGAGTPSLGEALRAAEAAL